MKLLVVLSLSAGILAAAEGPAKKGASVESARTVSARAQATVQIPARAVQGADGAYHFTDSQGRQWLYRKTPFGIARWQNKPEDSAAVAAGDAKRYAAVSAVEDGDTIHFERRGPFGVSRWDRKKSDLDEVEKTVWNREQSHTAAKQD